MYIHRMLIKGKFSLNFIVFIDPLFYKIKQLIEKSGKFSF